ncbi:MAG: redoxin domain-containing protein [Rubripirellula sp.]
MYVRLKTLCETRLQLIRIPLVVCLFAGVQMGNGSSIADEPESSPTDVAETDRPDASTPASDDEIPVFELSDDVRDVLTPLFSSIADAKVSRATVEMLADSVMNGKVVDSQKSTFQIASAVPDEFTIYLKEPEQRIRVYCDGESMVAALSTEAYVTLPEPVTNQQAVTGLGLPMGPYAEPLFSLTLAGVDPAISFAGGMKSIVIADRDEFRKGIPAVHLRGVQADEVKWDFWISDGDNPRPLRMLIDLTPMLLASDQVNIPANFSYQVRYDFLTWRVTGEIDPALFRFQPTEESQAYDSLQAYYDSIAGVVGEHPLLGQPAPPFELESVTGEKVSLQSLADKVVVVDFWATWCTPCVASMPLMQEVTGNFKDKDVVFLAVNAGETKEEVETFLSAQDWDVQVLLDLDGEVADAFKADAIPQSIVIGKDGYIESVHVGFPGEDALKQRLTEELEVLSVGGRIGSLGQETDEQSGSKEPPATPPPTR